MTEPDLRVPITRAVIGSSTVAEVGYDPDSATLEIAFRSGHVYRYGGVDAPLALPLLQDGIPRKIAAAALDGRWSYGGYVALLFRSGRQFPYVRVK